MIIATWLQRNCNDDVLISWNTIFNDECIIKVESEKDEFILILNEKVIAAIHLHNKLQKNNN